MSCDHLCHVIICVVMVIQEEKLELAKLIETVPIPIKESIEESTAKVIHVYVYRVIHVYV